MPGQSLIDPSGVHPYKTATFFLGAPLSNYALEKVATRLPDALTERYTDRSGADWGVVKASSIRDATPPIRQRLDPRRFRAVVLCSPVWAGKLAGPARTYLGQAGKVPLLCGVAVSGSGGSQARFFRGMEQLGGRDGIPTLSIAQRQVRDGTFERLLDPFTETVRTQHNEAA